MTTIAEAFALAWRHYQAGSFAQAEQLCRQILQVDPRHADAWCVLGAACQAQAKLTDAEAHFRRAAQIMPNHPSAGNFLGTLLAQQRRFDEAAACLEQLLRNQPPDAEVCNNLGLVRAQQGRWSDALASHWQAVQLQPRWADARANFGMALQQVGRLEEAVAQYLETLRLQPGNAPAHCNLGNALCCQGEMIKAVHHCREALRFRPHFPEAHTNLGNALLGQQKWDEAEAQYDQALGQDPNFAAAHFSLGFVHKERGNMPQATAHFQQGLRSQPSPKFRLQLATLLPPLYQSSSDLSTWRQRLTDNIRQLHDERFTLDLTGDTAPPPFRLVYQGLNDIVLQRQIAGFCSAPQPGLRPRKSAKIRVGFVSTYFKNHTIAHLNRGLIANLDRKAFSVTVCSIGNHQDHLAGLIRQSAHEYVEVSSSLPAARQQLAALGLDVLFFTDIGMEPITYSLAFSRFAPVQCVTWGHPVTTGIPTIDYFISSEHLETDRSEEHYSERLVRLEHLAVYYYRPPAPAQLKGREHFGLPSEGTLYVCPQTLFKFHPEFDAALGDVLRRDSRGYLVLIEGYHSYWTELLRRRFAATIPDVKNRILFVPPLDYPSFLNLSALAEVLLDPLHYGGGNTSYEGLSLGTPIVTLPTQFLRSRITLALYKQMGVMDCVASSPAEYVELAIRLGTDADYRAGVRGKILAANEVLFENKAGVRALERFLQETCARLPGTQN